MGPANNPEGKNQYGEKKYPSENELKESLAKYTRQNLTREQKIDRLERDHKLKIGITKLTQLERKYAIPTVRRPGKSKAQLTDAIAIEVQQDKRGLKGPRSIKAMLRNKGLMVTRKIVREAMHSIAPAGFDIRYPGKHRSEKVRVALWSAGPYHEISADGHEKLNSQALRLGDVSLPIYIYREKWSGAILELSLLPDARTAASLGHFYLDFITKLGGVPIQMTTDKGPEIGWQYSFQTALRTLYAPGLDVKTDPAFVTLKSTSNTISEAIWRFMGDNTTRSVKDILMEGRTRHIFHPHVGYHADLFYWVFVPLVQKSLDEFKDYWNNHQVRRQVEKEMPSNHVPQDALDHPEAWGAESCLIKIEKSSIDELRALLTEEVGPREQYLTWYSAHFAETAAEAYEELGSPELNLETAWDVFGDMSRALEGVL